MEPLFSMVDTSADLPMPHSHRDSRLCLGVDTIKTRHVKNWPHMNYDAGCGRFVDLPMATPPPNHLDLPICRPILTSRVIDWQVDSWLLSIMTWRTLQRRAPVNVLIDKWRHSIGRTQTWCVRWVTQLSKMCRICRSAGGTLPHRQIDHRQVRMV